MVRMEPKKDNRTLIRTNLTTAEYRAIRMQALAKGVPVGEYAGNTLRRALLKGAKP